MSDRTVSICAGWGGPFGAGHVQRMACLADYLRTKRGISAAVTGGPTPEFLPATVSDLFAPGILPGSSCIIRDCRDSSADDMLRLKAIAPVIAIDDCGPGRDSADAAIDLLPNLRYPVYQKEIFLFGYNFVDSVRRLGNRRIGKDIDIALYCGLDAPRGTVRRLVSFLPPGATAAVLAGKDSCLIRSGTSLPLEASYAETLASAKIIVTHFGITLYEGLASGCGLVCVNPTRYHADLADRAGRDIKILNLGVIDDIDPDRTRADLAAEIRCHPAEAIETGAIMRTIEQGLENFYSRIRSFLD
jgi:hypothetical protein